MASIVNNQVMSNAQFGDNPNGEGGIPSDNLITTLSEMATCDNYLHLGPYSTYDSHSETKGKSCDEAPHVKDTSRSKHQALKSNTPINLDENIFEGKSTCTGVHVKRAGHVLNTVCTKLQRQPNVNCRVETFGRICAKFDAMRKNWVKEMGFGGLLHLMNKQLPRMLCYWLMTRVDPNDKIFHAFDGKEYKLSKIQVRWVLGIPKGKKPVPKEAIGKDMQKDIQQIYEAYGKEWEFIKSKSQKVVKCKGIHITTSLMERAEGSWVEHEEKEFKTLFLLLALDMVLCPTQGSRLASDLVAAVCCAPNAKEYDWCGLVLEKLMENVKAFAKRFYVDGYAPGCGGCTIFLAIFYLDRLNRKPIQWGAFPRLKAWSMDEIRRAISYDRQIPKGDFGAKGCLDVAYGEEHPREIKACDVDISDVSDDEEEILSPSTVTTKPRARRGSTIKAATKVKKTARHEHHDDVESSSSHNVGFYVEGSYLPCCEYITYILLLYSEFSHIICVMSMHVNYNTSSLLHM